MTPEKAMEAIKNGKYEFALCADLKDTETAAIRMAIEALEKQIPKPIVRKRQEDTNVGKCPVCGSELFILIERKDTFCWNCGQAILWEEAK